MAPDDGRVPPHQTRSQAAAGRPLGMGSVCYGTAAAALLDNGYIPLPIRPRAKWPSLKRWSTLPIGEREVEAWARQYPRWGIGLRTGMLVGVDVDILEPDLAHEVGRLVQARLGETLMRVGRWPKRLFVYRTDQPFAKRSIKGSIEVLGHGQQFVAFGIHPDIGQPYHWPLGESPLDVPREALPKVDAAACLDLLGEVAALLPPEAGAGRGARRGASGRSSGSGIVRNADGLVVDGRDAWLSTIAYHAVKDAVDAGQLPDRDALAEVVWQRFASTTDLDRPRKDRAAAYTPADAAAKVRDKLRLLAEGRLPQRQPTAVEAAYIAPAVPASAARDWLDEALGQACSAIAAWHGDEPPEHCPQIGIRATVGLRQERQRAAPSTGAARAARRIGSTLADRCLHAVARTRGGGGGGMAAGGRAHGGAAGLRGPGRA